MGGSRNNNYWMFMGRKNVDTANAAAGKELQNHCDNFMINQATKAGDCVITPSFNLQSSHGIQRLAHVVTPRMTALSSVEDSAEGIQLKSELQRCYFSPLMACDEAKLLSIGFPALSCGVGAVDPHTSARMMFSAIDQYLRQTSVNASIKSIH